MNNQTDLTIIPEDACDFYELSKLTETEDSIYWTMNIPYISIDFNYNNYKVYLVVDD